MRLKQITAPTMQEAMQQAKRALGDDAILLETRKLPGNRGTTLVFAIDGADDEAGAPPPPKMPPTAPRAAPSNPPRAADAPKPDHPALAVLTQALESHNAPASLLRALTESAQTARMPATAPIDAAESLLTDALAKHLKFHPIDIFSKTYPSRALMFVGPHGAGKTSAIAKLATQLTLAKQPVVLISTDTEHMGATETMQGLSDILKCELHIVNKRALLRELVKQTLGTGWILIDSFSVNIYEFAQMKALGELAGLQGIEPILTFPAEMDTEEAIEMAGVFSFLPIERVLVTRIDATRRLSSIFAVLNAGGYALSNLTNSSSPSEKAALFNPSTLAHLILRRVREKTTN